MVNVMMLIVGCENGWRVYMDGEYSCTLPTLDEVIREAKREGVKSIRTEGGWSYTDRKKELEKIRAKEITWGAGFKDYLIEV